MKSWYTLLVMAGFKAKEESPQEVCLAEETYWNVQYLEDLLNYIGVQYEFRKNRLSLLTEPIKEIEWFQALSEVGEENSELSMPIDQIELRSLDVHIAGLITQLNRLGLQTTFSCSGHNERFPKITFHQSADTENLARIFKYLKLNVCYESRLNRGIILDCNTNELPLYALKLSKLELEDLENIESTIKRERENLLETLLSIPGTSGNEGEIRSFLLALLKAKLNKIDVDGYGNLIGYKRYGGFGPTILLSAHMDIYKELIPGSKIIKENDRWYKDKGILGADDRAGIAMILELLDGLRVNKFNGALKVIITVEEEIGLHGARHIEPSFLWDIDYAIMLDRKNQGNLVTRSSTTIYASDLYGKYFEDIAERIGLGHVYKTCEGGSSDLKVWSAHDIDSINISIGYYNEHTEDEYLVISEWEQTLALALNAICKLSMLEAVKKEDGEDQKEGME